MANTPIVSDSSNGSYNGLLSTANGFYRAEAWNLSMLSNTYLPISTVRYINVTFANAGNCKGIVLGIAGGSVATTAYGVHVRLEQYATVTTPVASPGIVTWTGHGLSGGEEITFTTTGTLPTGITAGVVYFVKYIGVNTFNISATSGGANINFTGSSSGTHSCGVARASKELTAAEINPEYILGSAMGVSGSNYVDCITPFKFATPYAVDGTASKWRFKISNGITTGSSWVWNLNTSDGTNISYVTWCDTTVTSTNGDILIVVDKVTIDKSFTTGSAVGTGEATTGISGWICRSTDLSAANICLLDWKLSPASSYTFTFDANILMGSWSGFRVGTLASPIPYAQQAIITRTSSATAGSANTAGLKEVMSANSIKAKCAAFFYGEIPTVPYGILANDAANGATSIVTTVDLSSTWAVNDVIFIGKQDVQNTGSVSFHTITSFGGTTINFTPALNTAARKAGGTVSKKTGYGIQISNYSTTRILSMSFDFPCRLNMSGCVINASISFAGGYSYSYDYSLALPANRSAYNISDNYTWRNGDSFYQAFVMLLIPPEGIIMNRNIHIGFKGTQGMLTIYASTIPEIPFYSGTWEYKFNRTFSTTFSAQNTSGYLNIKATIEDNVWENGISTTIAAALIILHGNYFTFKRNYIWGNGLTGILGGAISLDTSISARFEGNHYDNNKCAITIYSTAFIIDLKLTNEVFGSAVANTADIGIFTGGYYDAEFINPVSTLTLDPASVLISGIAVSKFRITNLNSLTNDDSVITPLGYFKRCGDGLSDTTVHTSGSGKFSLRFQPTTYTNLLEWTQIVPTSNIQNLTMAVSVWVKINSATYYAGTNRKPRLNVDYDNGTVAYIEAASSTAWQLLTVSFSPTTTYGQIRVYIDGYTDATGSNAYFYVDDLNVFFPPGVQLSLGGLDLWANALPIVPSIATNVTAADIWNIQTSTLTSSGSAGAALVSILSGINNVASTVWASGTRTLTSFGTLVADITTAVWAAAARSLTTFGTLASDVWSVATRTLTAIGSSGIASESNATTNKNSVITQVDANETKIDQIISSLPVAYLTAEDVWAYRDGDGRTLTGIGESDIASETNATLNATGAHEDSGIIRADIALSAIKIDTIDSIVDTILVDTNEIQGKLPTNYMMGSGVTSDKDDEINAIKVKTDNLPSDPSSEANATSNKNSIIAEINANEVKIDSLAVDTSLILSELETVLALLHENSHVTNQVHNSEGKLLTADLNHYSNSTDLVNRSNPIRTFKIISSYDSSGLSSSFEIKRVL